MSLLAHCNTEEQIQALLSKCVHSTKLTGYTFFPEAYDAPFAPAHDRLLSTIDDPERGRRVLVCGGRGIGKSTLLSILVARHIMFRLSSFILYISKSETMAALRTEAIKRMLVSNKIIRELPMFGDIRFRDPDDVDESFSKSSWVARWPGDPDDGIIVMPRGAGQQVRGLLYGFRRPDLIIIDDLEDKETITNDNIRDANHSYVISDVCRCVKQTGKPNWNIYYLDTLKHQDAVIARLMNSEGWEKMYLPVCDEGYKTAMDPFITQEMIDHDVKEAEANGTLDEYARECQCLAINPHGAKFQRSYFQRYDEDAPIEQGIPAVADDISIQSIVTCDPAKTTGDKSCKCAVVVWGIDRARRRFFVRDIHKAVMHPNDLYKKYFEFAKMYKAVVGGVEVTGLEEFIQWPMQNYMVEHGIYLPMVWCKARGKKENRAGMLHSIYANHQVWHNSTIARYIEVPLMSYPRCSEWDVLDAAAYLFEVMEQGKCYLGGSDESDEDDLRAFQALDKEHFEDLDHDYYYDGIDAVWAVERGIAQKRRLPRSLTRS